MTLQRQQFMTTYQNFRVSVPEGRHGLWEVRRQTMTEREASKRKKHPEDYKNTVDMRDVLDSLNTLFKITEGPES